MSIEFIIIAEACTHKDGGEKWNVAVYSTKAEAVEQQRKLNEWAKQFDKIANKNEKFAKTSPDPIFAKKTCPTNYSNITYQIEEIISGIAL